MLVKQTIKLGKCHLLSCKSHIDLHQYILCAIKDFNVYYKSVCFLHIQISLGQALSDIDMARHCLISNNGIAMHRQISAEAGNLGITAWPGIIRINYAIIIMSRFQW